ncbi:hypothetical protein DPMN_025307 [Dreissena polymorpha]|uniref:Uncharacterized protein n=1 Tax=Dreissena polymorpha TaxID=45954 RepID=A0A9D4LQV8_DREPO|nr:hypothetical protein DPMN_025307 [Dreissena polymorpha]
MELHILSGEKSMSRRGGILLRSCRSVGRSACLSVGRSVGPSTRWLSDDNSRTLGPRIMKLHRYIDRDSKMTPIDFQVTRVMEWLDVSFETEVVTTAQHDPKRTVDMP